MGCRRWTEETIGLKDELPADVRPVTSFGQYSPALRPGY